MNKILLIGNDASLVERIERIARGAAPVAYPVRVEVVDENSQFSIRKRRPSAVVLDVRSPTATTLSVFSNLNARRRKVPLLLHLTAQQIAEHSWRDFFSETEAAQPFTEQTSESDFQKILLRLLAREHPRHHRVSSRIPSRSKPNTRHLENSDWHEQNKRRVDLGYKQLATHLTPEEQAELTDLQEIVSRHINQAYPLPFEALEAWEAAVRSTTQRK